MSLEKISTDKDVWVLDVSGYDGINELQGEIWNVKFHNQADGDKSSRKMFADQMTCTVTAAKGFTGTDKVTVEDDAGNTAVGEETFG